MDLDYTNMSSEEDMYARGEDNPFSRPPQPAAKPKKSKTRKSNHNSLLHDLAQESVRQRKQDQMNSLEQRQYQSNQTGFESLEKEEEYTQDNMMLVSQKQGFEGKDLLLSKLIDDKNPDGFAEDVSPLT